MITMTRKMRIRGKYQKDDRNGKKLTGRRLKTRQSAEGKKERDDKKNPSREQYRKYQEEYEDDDLDDDLSDADDKEIDEILMSMAWTRKM